MTNFKITDEKMIEGKAIEKVAQCKYIGQTIVMEDSK